MIALLLKNEIHKGKEEGWVWGSDHEKEKFVIWDTLASLIVPTIGMGFNFTLLMGLNLQFIPHCIRNYLLAYVISAIFGPKNICKLWLFETPK